MVITSITNDLNMTSIFIRIKSSYRWWLQILSNCPKQSNVWNCCISLSLLVGKGALLSVFVACCLCCLPPFVILMSALFCALISEKARWCAKAKTESLLAMQSRYFSFRQNIHFIIERTKEKTKQKKKGEKDWTFQSQSNTLVSNTAGFSPSCHPRSTYNIITSQDKIPFSTGLKIFLHSLFIIINLIWSSMTREYFTTRQVGKNDELGDSRVNRKQLLMLVVWGQLLLFPHDAHVCLRSDVGSLNIFYLYFLNIDCSREIH